MNSLKLLLLATLLPLIVLLTACPGKEIEAQPEDNSLTEVEATLETEAEADGIIRITEEALTAFDAEINDSTITAVANQTGQCWSATLNPSTRIIDLDFDGSCQNRDGRYREGMLTIKYAINWRARPDSAIQITPVNLYSSVNAITSSDIGNRVEGGFRFVKIDSLGLSTRISVTNGKLTRPDGSTSVWNSERVKKFSIGSDTKTDSLDDVFSITSGNSTGTTAGNRAFRMDVVDSLVIKNTCWYNDNLNVPVSGKIQVKAQGKSVNRILDYGNGACDKSATVTISGNEQTITLP